MTGGFHARSLPALVARTIAVSLAIGFIERDKGRTRDGELASRRWAATDIRDLTGRTFVVTGASSGIGLETARELVALRAHTILAVRDVEKGRQATKDFCGSYEVRELNLADLESVRAFAAEWTGDLDVLINNAGIMMAPAFRTIDDFELHMGTNHLGPFALTNLLLPVITDRVVTVSSILHRRGSIRLDDLHFDRRPYSAMTAYQDSKLANLLFTLELQRRLCESGSKVRAVAAHPGIARTNLVAHVHGVSGFVNTLTQRLCNDAAKGASPLLYAATQDVPGGCCVGPNGIGHLRGYPIIHKTSGRSMDTDMARRLWDVSAELTSTGG
jgi:NAD(P)-dependent dehydrogenase (short-subunit alcohol dehydrogenase family)